jgi:hypothetical protein
MTEKIYCDFVYHLSVYLRSANLKENKRVTYEVSCTVRMQRSGKFLQKSGL